MAGRERRSRRAGSVRRRRPRAPAPAVDRVLLPSTVRVKYSHGRRAPAPTTSVSWTRPLISSKIRVLQRLGRREQRLRCTRSRLRGTRAPRGRRGRAASTSRRRARRRASEQDGAGARGGRAAASAQVIARASLETAGVAEWRDRLRCTATMPHRRRTPIPYHRTSRARRRRVRRRRPRPGDRAGAGTNQVLMSAG